MTDCLTGAAASLPHGRVPVATVEKVFALYQPGFHLHKERPSLKQVGKHKPIALDH
jgi:hypothetical protein